MRSVSYTHLDVYKRQTQAVMTCPCTSRSSTRAYTIFFIQLFLFLLQTGDKCLCAVLQFLKAAFLNHTLIHQASADTIAGAADSRKFCDIFLGDSRSRNEFHMGNRSHQILNVGGCHSGSRKQLNIIRTVFMCIQYLAGTQCCLLYTSRCV